MDSAKTWCWIICLLFSATALVEGESVERQAKALEARARSNSIRRPKLSFLQLVAPLAVADNCKSAAGFEGNCLSAQDCLKRGGRGLETCAWGLGVCCVHASSCGGETSSNSSYFVSPNYPNPWTSNRDVCTFTVKPRLFSKICQLRLDFEDFYITGPSSGVCNKDIFVASGQDLNNILPTICGLNSGQHMYLQVASSPGPYRFTISTEGERQDRRWKIRITQIPCGSGALAPPHCLQYYTGSVGSFKSFNFGNPEKLENTYFQNMDYTTCIRKEAAMCGATFTSEAFNLNVVGSSVDGCTKDYLSFGADRKCGTALASPAEENRIKYGNSGPLALSFVSDNKTNEGDSGFSLKYSQYSCSSRI